MIRASELMSASMPMRPNRRARHIEAIDAYLEQGGTLTVAEALTRFGCFALSQRIGDLRRRGRPVVSEWIETDSGARVKRYSYARGQQDLPL